jgi:hypothetical protein
LDVLEALHPGELRKLLLAAILRYYDGNLGRAIDRALEDAEMQLSEIRADVIREFTDECDEIRDERLALDREIKAALDEVQERFREREEALEEKMQGLYRCRNRGARRADSRYR